MSKKPLQITREDLDHFFKQDYNWFDYYGQEERNDALKQIYDGLLKVINDHPTYTKVIDSAS